MRSFITALLPCIIVFSLGEIGARLWVHHHGDALDLTKSILEMDAELGWKQRASLNASFLKKQLSTDERGWRVQPAIQHESDAKTVLVLGPSSTFGWGVNNAETYPAQLANILDSGYRVENAGEIGYSSEQGVRLVRSSSLQELQPDVIILAYGVNDLDRHRFYFQSLNTDAEEFSKERSSLSLTLANLLSQSSLLNVGSRTTLSAVQSLVSAIRPADTIPQRVRVPPEDFTKNFRTLIKDAKQMSARVIVLSTVVHMPESTLSEPEVARVARGVEEYNHLLRSLALETQVTYIDLGTLFPDTNPREAYFADPIHFSALGNSIVAAELERIIREPTQPAR